MSDLIEKDFQNDSWKLPFFTIWTGQALSLAGSRVVQFALIWWLTKQSGSAIVLTIASLAWLVPMLVLSPFIGVFVDRWNRRRTMLTSDTVIALTSLILAALFAQGSVSPKILYVFLAVQAIAGCFHTSSMRASTPLLVPQKHLIRVQGFNISLQGTLNIVAAPLGALLLAILPIEMIMVIDVATALPAILTLFCFQIPQPQASQERDKKSFFGDFVSGLEYLYGLPGLLLLIALISMLNLLLTPLQTLLPLLVTEHFQGEAKHLALLESCLGIGIVSGGLILSLWRSAKAHIQTILFGFLGFGLSILMIATATKQMFPIALLGIVITGIANAFTNAPFTAIIQTLVKPEMQGRIFSLIATLSMGAGPLGLLIAGPLAEMYDARTIFFASGVLCCLIGVGSFFCSKLLEIEQT